MRAFICCLVSLALGSVPLSGEPQVEGPAWPPIQEELAPTLPEPEIPELLERAGSCAFDFAPEPAGSSHASLVMRSFEGPSSDFVLRDLEVLTADTGPSLFAAGEFDLAGAWPVASVARWDGYRWNPLADGLSFSTQPNLLAQANDLEIFDAGFGPAIYVGGNFSHAGPTQTNAIARWAGSGWSRVGFGFNEEVRALATFDDGGGPALYAFGDFTLADFGTDWRGVDLSVAVEGVARWNGERWTRPALVLPPGSGRVLAAKAFEENGVEALFVWTQKGIWRWDGVNLAFTHDFGLPISPAAGALESVVRPVLVNDGGGTTLFSALGGNLLRWNGAGWSAISLGQPGTITGLVVHDDGTGSRLYAGLGTSTSAGRVLRSNGGAWSEISVDLPPGTLSLASFPAATGVELYAFTGDGGRSEAVSVWRWRNAAWQALGGADPRANPLAMTELEDGGQSLAVVAGSFSALGGAAARNIAWKRDGIWQAMGAGLDGPVNALLVGEEAGTATLFAGTAFGVSRWTGSAWEPVGSMLADVRALELHDDGSGPKLFAGGHSCAFGDCGGFVARWDGTVWTAVAASFGSSVESLLSFDDGSASALFAGGSSNSSTGTPIRGVARWRDGVWSFLGADFDGPVHSLIAADLGAGVKLIAAGGFTRIGAAPARRIAVWSGSQWNALGSSPAEDFSFGLGPSTFSTSEAVLALATFDFGLGSELVAAGRFAPDLHYVGPTNLARLRDGRWEGFHAETEDTVRALLALPDGANPRLLVGGSFWNVDGMAALGLVALAQPARCPQPAIDLFSPVDGLLTRNLEIFFSGRLDELATVTLSGSGGVTLAPDLSFLHGPVRLREGTNSFDLKATRTTHHTTSVPVTVTLDSRRPSLRWLAPADGSRHFHPRPELRLFVEDRGAGAPAPGLVLRRNGSLLGASCSELPAAGPASEIRCRPLADLPAGASTLTAEIADAAGNSATSPPLSIVIDAAASWTTTVVGEVRRVDGTAVGGARVSVLGPAGASAVSASDGSFSIALALESAEPLTVVAQLPSSTQPQAGVRAGIPPVPGGITPAGTLTLEVACSPVFESALFAAGGLGGSAAPRVVALAVYNGRLYAGGDFTTLGGMSARYLASWDGVGWSAVGGGLDGPVRSLAVFDGALVVGGDFATAGTLPAARLARWDGSTWSAVGGGVSVASGTAAVYALTTWNDGSGPALYAGGIFNSAGGTSALNIARWNGVTWSALGAGLSRVGSPGTVAVRALAVFDEGAGPRLFAGGHFDRAGSLPLRHIARWDGAAWSSPGVGVGISATDSSTTGVHALAVHTDALGSGLFVGGSFSFAGASAASSLARWTGQRWIGYGGSFVMGDFERRPNGVQALLSFDDGSGPALYAAGNFTGCCGSELSGFARWSGAGWESVDAGITPSGDGGMALGVFDEGQGPRLFVAGGFTTAGTRSSAGVARWDGDRLTPLGGGTGGSIEALAVFDDGHGTALFLAGDFLALGGVDARRVVRWDGRTWSALGDGLPARVNDLEVFDAGSGPRLVAALGVSNEIDGVASWDGARWSELGGGTNGIVRALEVFDPGTGPALYATGAFTTAGGVAANRIARWNGTAWSALGSGLNGEGFALEVHAGALIAGGAFTTAGGLSASRVARWNGTAWSALGGGLSGGATAAVRSLLSANLGSGSLLYAGTTGISAPFVSSWNGSAWTKLGVDLAPAGSEVRVLAVHDDGRGPALYAGGTFREAGGRPASFVARWNGAAWSRLGGGLDGGVSSLVTFDDGRGSALVLGGEFLSAGGASSPYLALWRAPLACPANGRWDATAPTLTLTAPAASSYTNQRRPSFGVSFSDLGSGIDTGTLSFTLGGTAVATSCTLASGAATCTPTADLSDGAKSLVASIADLAGNYTATPARSFTVDTTSPSLAFTQPLAGARLPSPRPQLKLGFSDSLAGVDTATLAFQQNGQGFATSCTFTSSTATCTPVANLALGAVTLTATVRDRAGNSKSAQIPVTVFDGSDLVAPAIVITAPASGSAVSAAQPQLVVSHSDAGAGVDPATLSFTLGGAALAVSCSPAAGGSSCTPVAPMSNGSKSVTARVSDLVGNSASSPAVTFTVDTVAPVISFLQPQNGATVSSPRPDFRLSISETGSGMDTASLVVTANGLTISTQCSWSTTAVTCRPATELAPGATTLSAQARDRAGNASNAVQASFTVPAVAADEHAPWLVFDTPSALEIHDPETTPVRLVYGDLGSGVDPASLRIEIDGESVPYTCSHLLAVATCTFTEPVADGLLLMTATVHDRSGNLSNEASVRFPTLAPGAGPTPDPVDVTKVVVGAVTGFRALVSGSAGAVPSSPPGTRVEVRNRFLGSSVELSAASDGSFSGLVPAVGGEDLLLTVLSVSGRPSESRTVPVPGQAALLPDPASVAPPVPGTAAPDLCEATRFLVSGATPIQVDLAADALRCDRLAIVRGRVLVPTGEPLVGAVVRVASRPELGFTLSRSDGRFDFGVEAGGSIRLALQAPGFLPAQRRVRVEAGETRGLADIVLVPRDLASTSIHLGAAGVQVARGSAVVDADGHRRATVLFPEGTSARIETTGKPDLELQQLTVRATEYTVGPRGEAAMPGDLPNGTDYTYAVELAADEVEAVAGDRLVFNHPVMVYVENFVGIPVGSVVPSGYFDRQIGRWVASLDGVVITLSAIADGMATMSLSPSGVAATPAELAALGVSDAERAQLASLYTPGTSLWRVPVTHFTPWDFNYFAALEAGARPPEVDAPEGGDQDKQGNPCPEEGSLIECENQILGETLGLAGTSLTLHYRSDRVAGRKAAFRLEAPLSGDELPAGVQRIDWTIDVAGQRFERSFAATPNQSTTFEWDGRSAYGQSLQGMQSFVSKVGYAFEGRYSPPPPGCTGCFGDGGSGTFPGAPARSETVLTQVHRGTLGFWDAKRAWGLGGWSLSAQHFYDATNQMLYFGTGERRHGESLRQVQVLATTPGDVADLDVADDGSVFTASLTTCSLYRTSSDREVERVAGSGSCAESAQQAGVSARDLRVAGRDSAAGAHLASRDALSPSSFILSVEVDSQRRPYFMTDHGIFRIESDGTTLTKVVGPALGSTPLVLMEDWYELLPRDFVVAPDGLIFLLTDGNPVDWPDNWDRSFVFWRIDLVEVSAEIWVAGNVLTSAVPGASIGFYDHQPPLGNAHFTSSHWDPGPGRLALAPDGTLYFSYDQFDSVWRLSPEGKVDHLAGRCIQTTADDPEASYYELAGIDYYRCHGLSGDGGPGSIAQVAQPRGLLALEDGSLLVADAGNNRIRKISPSGEISTYLETPAPFALGQNPDGALVIGSITSNQLQALAPALPASSRLSNWKEFSSFSSGQAFGLRENEVIGAYLIASEDGSILYEFDLSGRHLFTRDAQSNEILLRFGYGPSGWLASVTDAFGNVTTIERDVDGRPLAVVGPFGGRTELLLNPQGYLERVTNALAESVELAYTQDGLLTSLIDPRGFVTTFGWDADGRLLRDTDPLSGFKELERLRLPGNAERISGHEVKHRTALARETTYRTELLRTGVERRTVIAPDGTQTVSTKTADGSRVTMHADGTRATLVESSDPRFGRLAPLVSEATVTTPGGLSLTTTSTRQLTRRNPLQPNTEPNDVVNLLTSTDAVTVAGRTTTSVYDFPTRTMTVTSPQGRTSTATRDIFGRLTTASQPGISSVNYSYDANGRVSSMSQADRTVSYQYDAQGFLQSTTDPLGRTASTTRDAVGRVLAQTLPDGRVVQFTYDASGNLTSIRPPSRPSHHFEVDADDQSTRYTPPDVAEPTGSTYLAYNLDHQVTSITRPDGQQIVHAYDAQTGRLANTTTPRGAYTPSYDATTGNVTSLAGPGGNALAFTYDGSLPLSVTWSGDVAGSVSVSYNSRFEVAERKINSTHAIAYDYDLDGLPTEIGALFLSYNPTTGLPTGSVLASTSDTTTFSNFGELASLTSKYNTTDLYAASFTRDKLGRITSKTETIGGTTSTYLYTFDVAGRLTEVKKDGAVLESYQYDANSNRTAWTDPWGSGTASYDDQDRLLTAGSTSFTYTRNGELRTKSEGGNTITYDYDVLGQILGATLANGVRIDYLLDPSNRRIGKKINGTLVQGLLWEGGRVAAELDGAGNVVATFVYGRKPITPEYMVKGGTTYRLIADHLGSVRLVVNATTGEVAQRLDYSAFGRVMLDSAPGFQPFGFAGGLFENQTGLARFGARDYDPSVGRWTAKDPVGFAGGDTNLYGYVLSDPVNFTDPSGLVAPLLVAWAYVEAGLTIHDIYDFFKTLGDPCADFWDKLLSGGGLIAGAVAPGGGYGKIGKWARKAWKASDRVGEVGIVAGREAAERVVRSQPRNLAEKLALDEAQGGAGRRIMQGKINDSRYPEDLWAKMEHVHRHPDGTQTVIHYWEHLESGLREGYKFK